MIRNETYFGRKALNYCIIDVCNLKNCFWPESYVIFEPDKSPFVMFTIVGYIKKTKYET